MDLKNKVAVITGVSKGIGAELCRQLLDEGVIVFGLGRNQYPDNHENFTFIATDVRNYTEVETAFEQVSAATQGSVDILINNAGLGYFGNVEDLPMSEWDEMVQTNLNAMFYCTRLTVPKMKEGGQGHIMNIASIAGLEGMPMVSGYCATKFAVKGFSESLYKELRDFKIKVTCIYPGSVRTDFFRNSPNIKPHDYMLMPEDVAAMMVNALKTPDNFHQVNIEVRPLQPKGPKVS
jgi:short-subunit dehydrogenase